MHKPAEFVRLWEGLENLKGEPVGAVDKARLVVAEDHEATRENLAQLLAQHSYCFEVVGLAANGFEALEFCLECKPDILILDLHMPGHLDGYGLLRLLRRKLLPVKILVLTSDKAGEEQVYRLGADKFLLKGISSEVILATLFELAFGYKRFNG